MNVNDIKTNPGQIPLGISNRHIHLSAADFKTLFGADAEPTMHKPVKQPGQFACKELVTVEGPKGVIKDIRMLGPYRGTTQLEVSAADARKLGVEPPIRDSGKLEGTPGVKITGPKGSVTLTKGVIIAKRHIHFSDKDAAAFGVKDGQEVCVVCGRGSEREALFGRVLCRVSDKFLLEMHLDIEEANAACVKNGDAAYLA